MRAHRMLPVTVVLAVVLAAGPAGPAAAAPPAARGPRVVSRHAILVDAGGGEVLWGRGSRTPRPPASLTKMLTALAVRASLDLDGRVAASRVAARQPARRLAIRRGQRLTVEQALKALMIVSANDVAVMLAEGAGGSVGRMRRTAFTSPSGRRHTLTARSQLLLGYRGAVGIKTGLTDDAGHCLAAAATRHGRTLIAIVLDSPDNAADAGRMLDWGFGRGRSARTGLRLPAYVAPASVASLLVRPPRAVERHRPPAHRAASGATGGEPHPDGSAAQGSGRAAARAATGAGATAALLATLGLVMRRRRRGQA
ncbi:MAG TPA: hypothetical protein VFU54_05445 [Actinomycetota bacterium]|nr:hypothetical protein [Actinomycetota bacterium]